MLLTRRRAMLGLATAAVFPVEAVAARSRWLSEVNARWITTEQEARSWHAVKDELGPALTGTPSWHRFLEFLETSLDAFGCVDVHRSPWTFTRMESSVWPDDSAWSLSCEGRSVPLANHGANCGLTGPEGVTAPLVLWDPENPPEVAGKIVVFRPVPRAQVRTAFGTSDYERATPDYDGESETDSPVPESISPGVWDELTASSDFVRAMADARPMGVVFAMNLNRAATEGLYTFRVPEHYDFPSAYVDRTTGDALIADARAGRQATLRVEGERSSSEAYQLVAYLPGRHFATERDQQIHLRTHTDGPSISQDNGALGLLAVVRYMSQIPRRDRPRTLFLELDCRHFMPGAEGTWAHEDYFVKFPGARDRIVAQVAMEHLGQIEYVEAGEAIVASGRPLATWVYTSADEAMIDAAYAAAVEHRVPRTVIRSPGRPGSHGGSQGPWYGMSRQGALLGLPTFGIQGDVGAYWAVSARMDRFDARLFAKQVAMFAKLTGFLMAADLSAIEVAPIERVTPSGASR